MSNDPKKQLEAATVPGGILAINPNGGLVRLQPGSVKLAASVERGVYLDGLKEGWRLAGAEDVKSASAKEEERRKKGHLPGTAKASGA